MLYPVYIYLGNQRAKVWIHNGCIYVEYAAQTTCLCRPQCTPSGCTIPTESSPAPEPEK